MKQWNCQIPIFITSFINKLICSSEGEKCEEDSIGVPTREKNSKTVTDADAAEMGQVLQDMRSLALGIQEEQDRQLQQLDLLSDSVDKAYERIRTDVRQVNKLT